MNEFYTHVLGIKALVNYDVIDGEVVINFITVDDEEMQFENVYEAVKVQRGDKTETVYHSVEYTIEPQVWEHYNNNGACAPDVR